MAIQPTNAATQLASNPENVGSHELISLLMAGGLERIAQAKASIDEGGGVETDELIRKTIAIIDGLRGSLDFKQGGDIAVNLGALYEYMLSRIKSSNTISDSAAAMSEVEQLLAEVKLGWDQMLAARDK